MKLVSVIIPTYKRPGNLICAVESVLNQTYSNIEIIVVDDNGMGSEYGDLTVKAMERYIDKLNVRYIRHPKNINGSAARNTGYDHSGGEYI